MSSRELKPRMLGLLPCQLNAPAPSVMPGALRNASFSELTPRSSSNSFDSVAIDCGVSRMLSLSFASALSSRR
jgi:hypothetical protein